VESPIANHFISPNVSPTDLKFQPTQELYKKLQLKLKKTSPIIKEAGGPGENVTSKSLKERVKDAFLTNPFSPFVTNLECYRVGKVLGKGAFGKVNLALHKLTKKFLAIKSINK